MTLRFVDGFDHYAIPSQLPLKYGTHSITMTGSSAMITMAGRRSSSTALLFRTSDYISQTFEAQQTWIVGFGLYLLANETAELIRFSDEAGVVQATVGIGVDGAIRVNRGSFSTGTTLAVSTNAFPALTWNFIEVKLTIADSGGVFQVRVNESMWIDFTGDTKQTTLEGATRITLYGRGTDCAIDDLYICDGSGSLNNDFLGDVRVDTVRPIGDGHHTEFSRQGGSSNWENVDDTTTIDEEASYNYSNTIGHRDVLDCGSLPSVTGNILGIQINMTARKDDAGGRTLRALARISGNDYEGVSQNIGTSYRVFSDIFEKNPDTDSAWIEGEINAAEYGYKVHA